MCGGPKCECGKWDVNWFVMVMGNMCDCDRQEFWMTAHSTDVHTHTRAHAGLMHTENIRTEQEQL